VAGDQGDEMHAGNLTVDMGAASQNAPGDASMISGTHWEPRMPVSQPFERLLREI
jgi:hypothetical protein